MHPTCFVIKNLQGVVDYLILLISFTVPANSFTSATANHFLVPTAIFSRSPNWNFKIYI